MHMQVLSLLTSKGAEKGQHCQLVGKEIPKYPGGPQGDLSLEIICSLAQHEASSEPSALQAWQHLDALNAGYKVHF